MKIKFSKRDFHQILTPQILSRDQETKNRPIDLSTLDGRTIKLESFPKCFKKGNTPTAVFRVEGLANKLEFAPGDSIYTAEFGKSQGVTAEILD